MFKKIISVFTALIFLISCALSVSAVDLSSSDNLNLGGKSAILMEETTGKVLYEYNADNKMPPASITKIMTLLLTMEAMEKGKFDLDTQITCSEHAASMGGSQIWLKEGERMSVDDIVKAVCIKSANDAAVVLAELVGGSEDVFVSMMNERAKELNMTNTHFENASGLDAKGHISTARDIAIMSRALMRHPKIFEYTKIWMDSLRNGKTELVNTNRLIRFYKGATGLKTGTTSGAGSCVSATAKRDNLSLIAVVMGYNTSKERNIAATKLLDYGFSKYKIIEPQISKKIPKEIKIKGGVYEKAELKAEKPKPILIERNRESKIREEIVLPKELNAPISKGVRIGSVNLYIGDKKVSSYFISAEKEVKEMTFFAAFVRILDAIF